MDHADSHEAASRCCRHAWRTRIYQLEGAYSGWTNLATTGTALCAFAVLSHAHPLTQDSPRDAHPLARGCDPRHDSRRRPSAFLNYSNRYSRNPYPQDLALQSAMLTVSTYRPATSVWNRTNGRSSCS